MCCVIVFHGERERERYLDVIGVLLHAMSLVAHHQEGVVGGLGHLDLFIQCDHDTLRHALLDQVQHGLVVDEGDMLIVDLLGLVEPLLKLEGILVEVLLQLLVGEVDAKLLEAVLLEYLEPEDVQHSYHRGLDTRYGLHRGIDPFHQPIEQPAIKGLHQCIPYIICHCGSIGNPCWGTSLKVSITY